MKTIKLVLSIVLATMPAAAQSDRGSIEGTVKLADTGAPVAGTPVQLFMVSGPDGKPVVGARVEASRIIRDVSVPAKSVLTNDRGEYRLFSLDAGKYVIAAAVPNTYARTYYPGVPDVSKAQTIDITSDGKME